MPLAMIKGDYGEIGLEGLTGEKGNLLIFSKINRILIKCNFYATGEKGEQGSPGADEFGPIGPSGQVGDQGDRGFSGNLYYIFIFYYKIYGKLFT